MYFNFLKLSADVCCMNPPGESDPLDVHTFPFKMYANQGLDGKAFLHTLL